MPDYRGNHDNTDPCRQESLARIHDDNSELVKCKPKSKQRNVARQIRWPESGAYKCASSVRFERKV